MSHSVFSITYLHFAYSLHFTLELCLGITTCNHLATQTMVLQHIYIVRHAVSARSHSKSIIHTSASALTGPAPQFRSQFILDPASGQYSSPIPCPTGIPTDPALTSYGEAQAEQLAQRLAGIEPAIDVLYSSPFYRCIQTLGPTAARLGQARGGGAPAVRIETGLG